MAKGKRPEQRTRNRRGAIVEKLLRCGSLLPEIRHLPRQHFLLPLIKQRPRNRARAEVRHVLILLQAIDRFLQDTLVAAKNRAVARQQKVRVVLDDALERLDEVRQVRAVMGVDHADTTVLVNVVAGEEE